MRPDERDLDVAATYARRNDEGVIEYRGSIFEPWHPLTEIEARAFGECLIQLAEGR